MRKIEVSERGAELLRDPMLNKSSAFSAEERRVFELEGLLPDAVSSMELQARRVYANIVHKTEPLERYIGLAALQDRNEHLFYRILLDNLEEFLPIVYTPTVGQASKQFSHIFRRGRGIWITPAHRGKIRQILESVAPDDLRLSVVTDNEAILGIGDQGAGGMVIPIGKLAIYCAAAGIHPDQTLPISLDVGTENQALLEDDLYLGWRQPRLRGSEYFDLVNEFVEAFSSLFPQAVLQWEDFRKSNAFDLLELHRKRVLSFNDDIQGTGATALAGLLASTKISQVSLAEQRIVIVGGGAAGIGIATQLHAALARAGLEKDDITRAVAVLDSRGLITSDRERLDAYKSPLAWPAELAAENGLGQRHDLEAVVREVKPTAIIGTSGQPNLFSEEIVREMARHVKRPVVMPFSNPNTLAEAQPEDVYRWTEGRALVATGSPFDPVTYDGRQHHIGQGNNAFVFPGMGLGALIAEASVISDDMFTVAAQALATEVLPEELDRGQLYPSISRLRNVTQSIAIAIARHAQEKKDVDWERRVSSAMWEPEYPELVPV